jgi:hypothetical protein
VRALGGVAFRVLTVLLCSCSTNTLFLVIDVLLSGSGAPPVWQRG